VEGNSCSNNEIFQTPAAFFKAIGLAFKNEEFTSNCLVGQQG